MRKRGGGIEQTQKKRRSKINGGGILILETESNITLEEGEEPNRGLCRLKCPAWSRQYQEDLALNEGFSEPTAHRRNWCHFNSEIWRKSGDQALAVSAKKKDPKHHEECRKLRQNTSLFRAWSPPPPVSKAHRGALGPTIQRAGIYRGVRVQIGGGV